MKISNGVGKKITTKLVLLLGAAFLFLISANSAKATICGSSHYYTNSTLNSPTHLQVFQVGNTIRVQGRIVFDHASDWYLSDPVNQKIYGCGFQAEIAKDFGEAYTACDYVYKPYDSGSGTALGIAGGNRVENSPVGKAECLIDTTFSIPASLLDQSNSISDILIIYPWWAEATRNPSTGVWTYPYTKAQFGSSLDAYGFNFSTLYEHISLTSPAVAGVCGTRATTYASTVTAWPLGSAYCSAGTASPSSQPFPAIAGNSISWTCIGLNSGVNSPLCTATRLAAASCTGVPANATVCTGDNTGLLANTASTVVATCSAPAGSNPKCEYTCNANFHQSGNTCVANCAVGCTDTPTACSVSCGGGTQSCTWQNADCSVITNPSLVCNTQACPADNNWKEVTP